MFRHAPLLPLCLFTACVAAQDIISALESVPELSELSAFLSKSPDLISWADSKNAITLLAPNNNAFDTLIESTPGDDDHADLLTYHFLDGVHEQFATDGYELISTLRRPSEFHPNVTGGQVVLARSQTFDNRTEFTSGLGQSVLTTSAAPIKFDSGIIHIIEGVLTLPRSFASSADYGSTTAFAGAVYTDPMQGSDVIGLDTVSNITVFLPIDYVWERIGNLVNDWTRLQLDRVLSYHVIEGVLQPVAETRCPSPGNYESLEGTGVRISVVEDETFINNAKVVSSEPLIFNGGLIYTIYGVLNPDNTTIVSSEHNTNDVAFQGAVMTHDFSFPNATEQLSNTTTSSNEGDDSQSAAAGLSTGAKAAIGVGVAAAAIFAGLAVAYCIIRRKRRVMTRARNIETNSSNHWDGQASASQRELLKPTTLRD